MSRREPVPIAPRMLTAEQAAAYLGYATTGVLANIPVKPVRIAATGPGSQPKYDRHKLDAWLDGISGLTSPTTKVEPEDAAAAAYGAWKTRKAG